MLNLDSFDRAILDVLQTDASLSTVQVAERVGLSQAPCWRRIQRLKDEGYIRAQVALLDRHKIGLRTQIFAMVKLTATGRTNLEDFMDAIRKFPEVIECHLLLGAIDFMLRIVTRDIEAYERFFFDELSRIPHVQEINTTVAMSDIKSTTALPLELAP
jgi:Lrp/AsnC family transcriptional regulator